MSSIESKITCIRLFMILRGRAGQDTIPTREEQAKRGHRLGPYIQRWSGEHSRRQ